MNIYKAITDEVLVPIHPAGWPFIFIFVLVSVLITHSGRHSRHTFKPVVCAFFRNPVRTTPVTDNLVIASAVSCQPDLQTCQQIWIYRLVNGAVLRSS